MLDGNLLTGKQAYGVIMDFRYRLQLVRLGVSEIGVRESSGNNDGKRVEEYLAVAGLKKGQPYFAAFVSWVYKQAGFMEPRSGWTPSLFPLSRLTKLALPGNLIGVYFPRLKRIAHVGMIEKMDGDWCVSIERNTNVLGSNDGDGVYRKRRNVKSIYRMADW